MVNSPWWQWHLNGSSLSFLYFVVICTRKERWLHLTIASSTALRGSNAGRQSCPTIQHAPGQKVRWRMVRVCSRVGQCRQVVCDLRYLIKLNARLNFVHCSSFASSKAELSASSHTFVHLQLLNISKTWSAGQVIRPRPSASYPCGNRHFTQNCQQHKAPRHGKPPADRASGLQVWRAGANILNWKQRMADKG